MTDADRTALLRPDTDEILSAIDIRGSADPRLALLGRSITAAGDGPAHDIARERLGRLRVALRNAWDVADRAATREQIVDQHLGPVAWAADPRYVVCRNVDGYSRMGLLCLWGPDEALAATEASAYITRNTTPADPGEFTILSREPDPVPVREYPVLGA